MSGTTQEVISLCMLIAFVITGASNAGIGRTGSYFLFQWSFALSSFIVVERIVSGMMVVIPTALITGEKRREEKWEHTVVVFKTLLVSILRHS